MNKYRYAAFLLLSAVNFLLLLTSCVTTHDIRLVEQSCRPKPNWLRKPPEDENILYFLGIATHKLRLEDAEHDAFQDAVRKIVEHLGLKGTLEYERRRTELTTKINDQFKAEGSALVEGVKLKELCYEKWQEKDEVDRVRYYYDTYVLLEYPKSAYKKAKRLLLEKWNNIAKEAHSLYKQGLDYETEKDYQTAWRMYSKAIDKTRELPEGTNVPEFDSPVLLVVEVEKRLGDIKTGHGLDESAEILITKLAEQFNENVNVTISDFTYRGKGVSGGFARYFSEKLKAVAVKNERFSVVGFVSGLGGKAIHNIDGTYWELADKIEVQAFLRNPQDNPIAEASTILDKEFVKDLSLLPEGFDENVSEKVSILTENHTQDDKIRVELWSDRGVYKQGEELRLYLRADIDCYVLVLYFQVDGEVVQLFPNENSISGYIKGNKTYQIPDDVKVAHGFSLKITPPFGTEVIKIFASKNPFREDYIAYLMNSKSGPFSVSNVGYRGILEGMRGLAVVPEGGVNEASTVITTISKK